MARSNSNTNRIPYVPDTASAAGGCGRKSVTTISDIIVRLEELTLCLGHLMDSGLVTRSDEVASARRRYQFRS